MQKEIAARPKQHSGLSQKRLIALLEKHGFLRTVTDCDVEKEVVFSGVTSDSRKVQDADIYCALPGANFHGATFYRQAIAQGAGAIVTDEVGRKSIAEQRDEQGVSMKAIPVFTVGDPRAVAAWVAAEIYGTRSWRTKAPLFAVTGTNGKTTTSYFIKSLLTALGKNPGLVGTVEISVGQRSVPSLLTTPEATDMHAYMGAMAEAGADSLSMEVSSHALKLHRIDEIRFNVAGFTNLSQDHLDFHGSMEEYFQSKALLFTAEHTRKAVVAIDDKDSHYWARRLCIHNHKEGIETTMVLTNPDSMLPPETASSGTRIWTVRNVVPRGWGYHFQLISDRGQRFEMQTGLPGFFNVANAALALVMVYDSGFFSDSEIAAALGEKPFSISIPGRMHIIAQEPLVVIDFAHNSAAMERVFGAFTGLHNASSSRRIIAVFGATGQRDRLKRPIMGEIAVAYADTVIVTDDDPHGEDAAGIRGEVLSGARRKKEELRSRQVMRKVLEVAPRTHAIETAVKLARSQDVVLILGRGHEVTQNIAGADIELDDREVARQALKRRSGPANGF